MKLLNRIPKRLRAQVARFARLAAWTFVATVVAPALSGGTHLSRQVVVAGLVGALEVAFRQVIPGGDQAVQDRAVHLVRAEVTRLLQGLVDHLAHVSVPDPAVPVSVTSPVPAAATVPAADPSSAPSAPPAPPQAPAGA